jgi:hypothetical protein
MPSVVFVCEFVAFVSSALGLGGFVQVADSKTAPPPEGSGAVGH